MDLKLTNYEVIYETLSASESDSEANESAENCASSFTIKENRARRKVIKNFIICQPMAQKKISNKQALSNANTAVCEEYDLDHKNICLVSSLENNKERIPWTNDNDRDLDDVGDVYPVATSDTSINNIEYGFSKEKFQKEELIRKDWSDVVNFVGSCGPSMNAIEKVIEETICRVLHEDLPSKFSGKTGIMGTIKNCCPDCNFSTLSKFLYKKHVALHENKPHLVFSQNICGNSLNHLKPNLKQEFYQCPHCSDLFRSDSALKYHKCIVTTLSAGSSGVQASGISINTVAGDKYDGTALECALRFLNQKPIDMEIAKEQVVPLDDYMISSVFNKDQYMKTLLDNKIDKLEKSVEELNKIVEAQSNFNVCTSHKLLGSEKQNITQGCIRANNNNNFFSSQKDAIDVKYLCKILEEPIDNKEETSALEEGCKQSFRLDEKDKSALKDLNSKHLNIEVKRKMTENNPMCDRTYDDLEKTMAILTGEENSNDKVLLKNTESGNIDSVNKTNMTSSNFTVKDVLTAGNSDIKTNNGNKDKRLTTVKKHSKNQSSHSCKLCDRIFKTPSSLKTHEHDVHFPDYFLCRFCDFKSKIKIDLKKHYRKKHYDTYARIFLK